MPERRALQERAPDRPEPRALPDRARSVTLTEEQLREQQASFVYGNAPKGSPITKESAREVVQRIRTGKVLHGTSDHPLIRGRGPPARGQAPSSAAQYNPLQKEPAPGPATLPSTLGLGVDAGERAAPWTCTFSATMFPARQRSGHRCGNS